VGGSVAEAQVEVEEVWLLVSTLSKWMTSAPTTRSAPQLTTCVEVARGL
jgi:hypothetical protein